MIAKNKERITISIQKKYLEKLKKMAKYWKKRPSNLFQEALIIYINTFSIEKDSNQMTAEEMNELTRIAHTPWLDD